MSNAIGAISHGALYVLVSIQIGARTEVSSSGSRQMKDLVARFRADNIKFVSFLEKLQKKKDARALAHQDGGWSITVQLRMPDC